MNKKGIQKALLAVAYCGWAISIFIAVPMSLDLLFQQIHNTAVIDWLRTPLGGLVVYIVENVIRVALLLLPFYSRKLSWKTIREKIGYTKFQGKMIPWAFFAWGLYFVAYIVIASVLVALPTGIDWQQKQDIGVAATNTWGVMEYVATFLALVVVAPIFEETVFRGYLFGRLRTFSGFWVSAIIVSVLFAFLHGQWNVAFDVGILSLVMCYLRERFKSIWPGVLVHGIKNGLAYTVLFILPLYGINLLK